MLIHGFYFLMDAPLKYKLMKPFAVKTIQILQMIWGVSLTPSKVYYFNAEKEDYSFVRKINYTSMLIMCASYLTLLIEH